MERRGGDFGNFCHLGSPISMPDNGRVHRDDRRDFQPSNEDWAARPDPPTVGERAYYQQVAGSGDALKAVNARYDAPNIGEGEEDHGALLQASAANRSRQYEEDDGSF